MTHTSPMGFNLIKIGELAQMLGMNVQTVRYHANAGTIPVRMISPKGTRYFDFQEVIDSLKGDKSKPLTNLNPTG